MKFKITIDIDKRLVDEMNIKYKETTYDNDLSIDILAGLIDIILDKKHGGGIVIIDKIIND